MPCWPDVWEHIKSLGPQIGGFVLIVAYTVCIALLLRAPRMNRRWLRLTSRLVGAVGLVPLVVGIPAILFALALIAGDPPVKTRVVQSQDGQQAELSYRAGFLGRDFTKVTLKHPGCCRHIRVFSHSGPSWFDDLKLEWRDNHHLQITYHSRLGDPQDCEEKVGAIAITCASLPWPGPSSVP